MVGFFRRFRRQPKSPADWFTCPACGAQVKVGALACRECGADDTTGWSEATIYDDLDLPEPSASGIPDTFEVFERMTEPTRLWETTERSRLFWFMLGVAVLFVVGNAVLVGLYGPW